MTRMHITQEDRAKAADDRQWENSEAQRYLGSPRYQQTERMRERRRAQRKLRHSLKYANDGSNAPPGWMAPDLCRGRIQVTGKLGRRAQRARSR